MCQRWLADPAKSQAGERNPQLGRGDIGIQVLKLGLHDLSRAIALGHELINAGSTYSHQGKLASHKEAVGNNQGTHSYNTNNGTAIHGQKPSSFTLLRGTL